MRNGSKPLEFMVVVDSWTFEQVEATLSGNRRGAFLGTIDRKAVEIISLNHPLRN